MDKDMIAPEKMFGTASKIFRSLSNGDWKYIPVEPYKKDSENYQGMTRRELVGKRGENTKFHLRYFEIDPGGYSTYEHHRHEHVVYVTRGEGEVRIGCRYLPVAPGDVIYVGPDDPHQFLNPHGPEPLGFLCVVDADRDRPVEVDGAGFCEICE
ncbi:MAG: cupin domain-containing protein [Acidobacteria bacterium]|nr:cupin domain-containing protein [Acidobacteriota bacterium]